MTFSPLTSRTIPYHGKSSSRRGVKVIRVNLHHWAGTSGGESRMTNPDADVSCNYLILSDGSVVGNVPEEERAWTSGSWEADAPAITIEVQNSSTRVVDGKNDHPESWPVSDAAYKSIINLLADIAKRHGWGDIQAPNLRGHREFSSTACPGGFLWNRLGDLRAQARALFLSGKKPTAPGGGGAPAGGGGYTPPAGSPAWAFNPPSAALQKRIQQALKNRGRYSGPVDGVWGPNSIKGIQTTIRNVGYTGPIDGIPGSNTCYYVQVYAKRFGDYSGPVDRVLGPFSWDGFALGLERP
jgi:hypothetical protein